MEQVTPDFYAANADLYAAISLPTLPGQLAALSSVVQVPLEGAVVEIGAGVGTALPVLATMTSDSLYAVEPSKYMRVGLMTKVAGDETLRKRVTVLSGTFDQAVHRLPLRLSGIVALNVLGHFEPTELKLFWQFASQRLDPGGQLVVGLQPPFEPVDIPWTDFGESRIGDLVYRMAGTASITSDMVARWTVRWTTLDTDGVELERREASTKWSVVGPRQVTDAAIAAGLELSRQSSDGTIISFRQPDGNSPKTSSLPKSNPRKAE